MDDPYYVIGSDYLKLKTLLSNEVPTGHEISRIVYFKSKVESLLIPLEY